jgi:flagellar assembly factor FliW
MLQLEQNEIMGKGAAVLGSKTVADSDITELTIESRYGPVSVNLKQALFFPKGLLGMPDMKDFCIGDLPDERLGNFKLLQSLNDHQLSFVVLPLEGENTFFDKEDVAECCEVTQIKPDNLLVLSIVSIQRIPGQETKITANIRAPLVIDVDEKVAIQYVFPNNKYQIRHPLN